VSPVPYAQEDDDAVVVYSVKELLSTIHDSVNRVETKLDEKASRAEVVALGERVSQVERLAEAIKNRAIGAGAVGALVASGLGYTVAQLTGGL
jgi:LPS O-antigen subunit length determinant protein (WzzB/FepE family)